MKLVLFSGNSLVNRDWIYEVHDKFCDIVDDCIIQNYLHWQTKRDWIDLDYELSEVPKHQSELGDNYAVFAKSIGTVLAVKSVEEGILKPKFLLFCGIPLNYIRSDYIEFCENLSHFNGPISVIQNVSDPVGSADDVRKYLERAMLKSQNFSFIESPGTTHDYRDFDLLSDALRGLIEKSA